MAECRANTAVRHWCKDAGDQECEPPETLLRVDELMLERRFLVKLHSLFPAGNSYQTKVVQSFQAARGRFRVATPGVRFALFPQTGFEFAGVEVLVAGYDVEHSLLSSGQRPLPSGVKEPPCFQGHESVSVEVVFFQFETAILTINLVYPVILHAVAQDQILSAGWRPDGICLNKAEPADGPAQCCRKK